MTPLRTSPASITQFSLEVLPKLDDERVEREHWRLRVLATIEYPRPTSRLPDSLTLRYSRSGDSGRRPELLPAAGTTVSVIRSATEDQFHPWHQCGLPRVEPAGRSRRVLVLQKEPCDLSSGKLEGDGRERCASQSGSSRHAMQSWCPERLSLLLAASTTSGSAM